VISVSPTTQAKPTAASPSPLDKLKSRSADERWREINSKNSVISAAPVRNEETLNSPVKALPDESAESLRLPPPVPEDVPLDVPFSNEQQFAAAGQLPGPPTNAPYTDPVRSPNQLKKVSAIQPYRDYEPDPEVFKRDRCQNLCPRPDGKLCPDCEALTAQQPAGGPAACQECPEEVSLRTGPYATRLFPQIAYNWEAPNSYNYPLYFEDYALERYGQTRNFFLQPLASHALFATQLLGLPYQISIDPVWKCRYTLGYNRVGTCAPFKYYQIPLNLEAAAHMGGVYTGGAFLFGP